MRFRCSSPRFLILICVHCVVSCSVPNIPLNALPLVAPALSLLLVQKKFCTRCLPLTPLPSSLLHFCSHSPPCSLCFLDQPPNVCTRDGICNVSSAHPLVPPLIHLRHGSIALPMCGAPKCMWELVYLTSPLQEAMVVRLEFCPQYLRRHSKNKPARVHLHYHLTKMLQNYVHLIFFPVSCNFSCDTFQHSEALLLHTISYNALCCGCFPCIVPFDVVHHKDCAV